MSIPMFEIPKRPWGNFLWCPLYVGGLVQVIKGGAFSIQGVPSEK